jgi:hypothetical protein
MKFETTFKKYIVVVKLKLFSVSEKKTKTDLHLVSEFCVQNNPWRIS